MRTRAAPRLQLFLALATESVLFLSLAWIWLGEAYTGLLLRLLSPLTPVSVDLQQHGHEILFLAQSATGGTVRVGIHGMMIGSGLILTVSVLLAVPSLSPKVRLPLIALAIFTAVVAHLAGLYMLGQHIDSTFRHFAATRELVEPQFSEFVNRKLTETPSLTRILSYLWLFIPSLIWLPPLLWHWWPRQQG